MLLNLKQLVKNYNLKIKGVIHIGAHFGQEFSTYEELGINNVMFFEPVPVTFKKLKEKIGTKTILHNIALGNVEGEIEMFIETANDGQSNSILKPELHLQQYPHIQFNNKITVPISKLDNYLDTNENFNFINIDVQGYELEVFKGGGEYLKYVDYIMTEVNRDEVYQGCPRVEELDKFLSRYNFKRVETTWDGGTWGDGFYVKG